MTGKIRSADSLSKIISGASGTFPPDRNYPTIFGTGLAKSFGSTG
jgi:hypothetical protein